jgi:glyoxylase-like metal-dependent hydrolase (beta-lactamase superfamily II)
VPGFPGVHVVAAGGHTPGSQIVVARVGDQGYVVTGDTVNHLEGVRQDLPKPFLYRLLVVPEWEARQRELRSFLRALEDQGLRLLVPHDQASLEASGVGRWGARPGSGGHSGPR